MNIKKFKAYWESIGKPDVEYTDNASESWEDTALIQPLWTANFYRIKGDRHWKLRQKWIESDFTLPLDFFCDVDHKWGRISNPSWNQDMKYREAEVMVFPGEPIVLEEKQSPLDIQHGGDHYQKLGQYQPWEVLAKWLTPEELKGAMKKEVISYLCREADKGGRLDIKKAAHTLEIYLELTKGEEK